MSLKDIDFQREYRSLRINVCKQFYIPALKEAVSYKRSVGYFSSSALVEISIGLEQLVKNGGRMQLIVSPNLSEQDLKAIDEGYEKRKEIIEQSLLRELDKVVLLKPFEEKSMAYLAKLIELEVLDIKIAVLSEYHNTGIYHEKLGLISDIEGNIIAFSGSLNETATGMKSNYETIDVFTSWSETADRVVDKSTAFEKIWNNCEEHVLVYEFPQLKDAIVKKYRKTDVQPIDYNLVDELEQYLAEQEMEYSLGTIHIPDEIELRDYQVRAIDNWEAAGYRGIFDMATGTGKTYTGLAAIARLAEHLHDRLAIIIVVPYQHLVEQWVEDIEVFGIEPVVAYSTSKDKHWPQRFKNKINAYNVGVINNFCLITTCGTFKSGRFQNILKNIRKNYCLVADEAHNLGAEKIRELLPLNCKYRLALSATIDRHFDDEGTRILKEYFGEICISLSLKEAIRKGYLSKYYYYPVVVYLTNDELEEYQEMSEKILKCTHVNKDNSEISEYVERLLIQRARLIASAKNKVEKLIEVMEPYKNDNYMLVYCGATTYKVDESYNKEIKDYKDIKQIEYVTRKLYEKYHMKVRMFTAKENREEREEIKKSFVEGKDLQVITAIKCLDEGINIPAIKRAFILASSTNPKEYIQRRGRVLRKDSGKKYAEIYDFITLPRKLEETITINPYELKIDLTLVERELNRMMEFADAAENPFMIDELRNKILDAYGAYRIIGGETNGE